MRLLIMGPQGVGKGTQAALLSEYYGIPAISTGDIFRYNIKNKTELSIEALKYIDKGELVPDELTNKIVKDRLAMDDAKNGWILDGYPRNASQVEALDAILGELDTRLNAVVALDADHDVLMERMKKRAEIEGRSDDTPEAIAKRLDVYAKEPRRCWTSTRSACSRRSMASAPSTRSRPPSWRSLAEGKTKQNNIFPTKAGIATRRTCLDSRFRVFLQVGVSSGTHRNRQGTERGSWLKNGVIEVEGQVVEALPNAMFGV